MTLRDLLKALIDTEDSASEIYEEIAKRSNGEIVDISLMFAKEEKSHSKRIGALLQILNDANDIVPMEISLLLKQFRTLNEKIYTEEVQLATRKELFLYALQMEKDSIVFYQEIEKLFEQFLEGKRLFTQLVEEERKHMYFILMKLHELK